MFKSQWISLRGGVALVALVVLVIPFAAKSQTQSNPPASAVVGPLTGIKTIGVNVIINDTDNVLEGTQLKRDLQQEQTEIELELRRSGIVVQEQGDCMLDVSLAAFGTKDFCVILVTATARRWVYLDQQGYQSFIAPVWTMPCVVWGSPEQVSSQFHKTIHQCTDAFLNNYLATKSATAPPSTQPVP